jgi:hypothetical protein
VLRRWKVLVFAGDVDGEAEAATAAARFASFARDEAAADRYIRDHSRTRSCSAV